MLEGMSSWEMTQWGNYDEIRAVEAEKQRKEASKGMKPRPFARARRGRR